jgi:hypothetical protein
MLSLAGWAGAVVLAAALLRIAAAGGRGERAARSNQGQGPAGSAAGRFLDRLPLLALALALWHAWLALRGGNPFALLFAGPAYLAVAVLLVLHAGGRRGQLGRRGRLGRQLRRGSAGAAAPAGGAAGGADGGAAGDDAAAAVPRRRAARGIPARLAAAAGLALLGLSVVRLVQLGALRAAARAPDELRTQARTLDLSAKSWPDAFDALCADLAVRYPFTAWKGIDWRRRCAAAAPGIAAAARRHDAAAWYRELREFAWDIPDGHVGLAGDDHGLARRETGGDFGLRLLQLDDGRVVAHGILPDGSAARAGLRHGAEISSWNGLPVAQALARVPILWAEWPPATAEARRQAQLHFLVRAPVGARAAVSCRNRGERQAATVVLTAGGDGALAGPGAPRPPPPPVPLPVRPSERTPPGAGAAAAGAPGAVRRLPPPPVSVQPPERTPPGAGAAAAGAPGAARLPAALAAPAEGASEFGLREALLGGAVEWRWLPVGVGYIRIKYELPTLWQVAPAAPVRRAVASFLARRAAGLVLDVRGNGGGLDAMVPAAAGYFLATPRIYEVPGVYDPGAGRFLPLPAHTLRAVPLPPHFRGRIAVLVDGHTISSGEGFPLALRGLANVAVFGFAGTGGFFAIDQRSIRLPGGLSFVVPVGQSLGADHRIQVDSDAAGRGGIAPDHRLAWTEETLDAVYREHRDLVLEQAVRWLLAAGPRRPARPAR